MSLPNLLTKETFSREVEYFVMETGSDYLDAVLTICRDREIEPETAAKLLNSNVKTMLEREAHELNLLVDKPQTLDFS